MQRYLPADRYLLQITSNVPRTKILHFVQNDGSGGNAWREFAEEYFPELAKRPAVVHGGGVLLPAAFPQTNLHVLRAGVFVGSVQKGRFVPEHHLFTAFGALCRNCEELTLADSRTVEYLSGREIEAHTAADGWCCVTVDGWPLGGGKVSGGRVKNHYPKALRLL